MLASESRPRLRADDPVDDQVVRRLEGANRPTRLRAEDPVGRDAEPLLDDRHRRPAAPESKKGALLASESRPRLRADDPVDDQVVRRLEGANRPTRLRAEDPVGRDAERALQLGYHGPTASDAEKLDVRARLPRCARPALGAALGRYSRGNRSDEQ